jgi:hypothetical protein
MAARVSKKNEKGRGENRGDFIAALTWAGGKESNEFVSFCGYPIGIKDV